MLNYENKLRSSFGSSISQLETDFHLRDIIHIPISKSKHAYVVGLVNLKALKVRSHKRFLNINFCLVSFIFI